MSKILRTQQLLKQYYSYFHFLGKNDLASADNVLNGILDKLLSLVPVINHSELDMITFVLAKPDIHWLYRLTYVRRDDYSDGYESLCDQIIKSENINVDRVLVALKHFSYPAYRIFKEFVDNRKGFFGQPSLLMMCKKDS